jgi:predicted O-methyltransferase YrrM
MLEKINSEAFTAVSKPSEDMVFVLKSIVRDNPAPVVAEVGVGVGATALACAEIMDNRGELHLFDFYSSVKELASDLKSVGFSNIKPHGNSRLRYDSYCWRLASMLKEQRAKNKVGTFDLAYLDGAHNFIHDAPAALLLAELLKPGGYLLFDDLDWTFATSPTCNPQANPRVKDMFTPEQMEMKHVLLICDLFFESNPRFKKVTFSGAISRSRALYRKIHHNPIRVGWSVLRDWLRI